MASPLFQRRIDLLAQDSHRDLMHQGLHGIERETLRARRDGHLAVSQHPVGLGSALTNAKITTDYSESLLEFITAAHHDVADTLNDLDEIHRYTYSVLGKELIWSESMPCLLPPEPEIPIAWYGRSHIGMLKHVYRRGLALRYGRTMQCIAGVHYNYSLSEKLWQVLQQAEGNTDSTKHFQSESYIALIRNFHRYSWLLSYLFGASPALDKNFLRGREHTLEVLSEDTLYLPYATSLRMSDLGYQNNAQEGLVAPYNTLVEYMKGLLSAVQKPYAVYQAMGTKRDGEWVQINTNVLQIENEFYASIRPKRVINTGERAIEALCARGVQYIEVRCMDVDPFAPIGITLETSRFLDAFLLFCALAESPLTNVTEAAENRNNFALCVKRGREPGLRLQRGGVDIELRQWGLELLTEIERVIPLLDRDRTDAAHHNALATQRAKLMDSSLTPSAKVLESMREHGNSFTRFALAQSEAHAHDFRARPLTPEDTARFAEMAKASLAEQEKMENEQQGSFDDFITDYRSRTPSQLCEG